MRITAKVTPQRKLKFPDPKKAFKKIQRINQSTAKAMLKDFEKTTRTWENKPEFEVETSGASGQFGGSGEDPSVTVTTDDDIYRYISRGTRVRYATMSPDFRPKTRVNRIVSYRGRGGMVFVDTSKPRPGIKARNYEKIIVKRHRKKYHERVRKVRFGKK